MRFEDGALLLLDQTELPGRERWLRLTSAAEVAEAIKRLAVRGAPAIGLAAAYGLAVEALHHGVDKVEVAAEMLASTRPTAVNLRWAIDRSLEAERTADGLIAAAERLAADQLDQDRRIGAHGAGLLSSGDRVLTHCNAGALATGGAGTAGAVLSAAWANGRLQQVWVDETRPLFQGARITAWELGRGGIPYELVPDSAAGALMSRGLVDAAVVGADRIAANGDVANKVGTYAVAALAARHGIPFYVAAPLSTIDMQTPDGAAIPIEERSGDEVTSARGVRVAPEGAAARNFAFDVTPGELVAGIVTEAGVLRPPFDVAIREALAQGGA
jgi:methylthioribose-1-phosphate isomerase